MSGPADRVLRRVRGCVLVQVVASNRSPGSILILYILVRSLCCRGRGFHIGESGLQSSSCLGAHCTHRFRRPYSHEHSSWRCSRSSCPLGAISVIPDTGAAQVPGHRGNQQIIHAADFILNTVDNVLDGRRIYAWHRRGTAALPSLELSTLSPQADDLRDITRRASHKVNVVRD